MPWGDILGQEYAKKVLKNSLESGRLHHAYLFCGPSGVGKGLAAKIYVQALNCHEFQGDGCTRCHDCRLIEDGTHPDVMQLLPAGQEFSIDQVRRIKRELSYKPVMGRRKVCILLEVERLTKEAANALLISLEEPPPEVTFIMSTTNPYSLLPTLLSRCQVIRFGPIPRVEVQRALVSWGISKEEASSIAVLAEGSLGRAKEYIQNNIAEKQEMVAGWLREIEGGGPLSVFDVAKQIISFKEEIIEILKIILYTLRKSLRPDLLLVVMERVIEIEKGIRMHLNLQLALEVMFLEYQRQMTEARSQNLRLKGDGNETRIVKGLSVTS